MRHNNIRGKRDKSILWGGPARKAPAYESYANICWQGANKSYKFYTLQHSCIIEESNIYQQTYQDGIIRTSKHLHPSARPVVIRVPHSLSHDIQI